MRTKRLMIVALGQMLSALPSAAAPIAHEFTVADARSLPLNKLATELLGERLGSRVIEGRRYEYRASELSIPQYVEFYTKPELTDPRLNGICRTDVVTIEYDWRDLDISSMDKPSAPALPSSTPLKIAHMEAIPRYKAFSLPPGEPGTTENDKAQAGECAKMTTAVDAFRAPSAGDAQWLAAIEKSYLEDGGKLNFTCSDFVDQSCASAKKSLAKLALRYANSVDLQDCPIGKTGDQIDYCYRIIFPYQDNDSLGLSVSPYADIVDYPKTYGREWVLTVWAGMRDGMSPVTIRALKLEHVPKSVPMP